MLDAADIAQKIEAGIFAGEFIETQESYVGVVFDGGTAFVFNDAGDPDYTENIVLSDGTRLEYGIAFGIGLAQPDPLDLISSAAMDILRHRMAQ